MFKSGVSRLLKESGINNMKDLVYFDDIIHGFMVQGSEISEVNNIRCFNAILSGTNYFILKGLKYREFRAGRKSSFMSPSVPIGLLIHHVLKINVL